MNVPGIKITLLLLLSFACSGRAENLPADSLVKMPDDSAKVEMIYRAALLTPQENTKERVNKYNEAIDLAKRINYRAGTVKAYRSLINYLYNLNMYGLASDYGKEFIAFCGKAGLKEARTEMYVMLANLFGTQGNYEEALKYLRLKGEDDLQKEDFKGYASVLYQVGNLHYRNGIYDSALINTLWSAEIFKRNNMQSDMAQALLNSARIYLKKENFAKAEEQAGEAAALYGANEDNAGSMHALEVLGAVYSLTGRADSALQAYNSALKWADSLHSLSVKKECYKYLSDLYGAQQKYKESYEYELLYRNVNTDDEARLQKAKLREFEIRYDLARSGKTPENRDRVYEGRQKNFILVLLGVIGLLTFLLVREKMRGRGTVGASGD